MAFCKQGPLMKQGAQRKNWKKRYFVLAARDPGPPHRPPLLSYYSSDKLGTALGVVNLDNCKRVGQVPYTKSHGGCSVCFEVEVPGRTYRMLTTDAEALAAWVAAIEEVAAQPKPTGAAEESDSAGASPTKAAFPPPANSDPGIPTTHFCRGYLNKLGAKVKSWKRRWFVLRGTTIQYHREKGAAALGKIDLFECMSVQRREAEGLEFGFEIVTPKRTYLMTAESEEELKMWIDSISAALSTLPQDRRHTSAAERVRTKSQALSATILGSSSSGSTPGSRRGTAPSRMSRSFVNPNFEAPTIPSPTPTQAAAPGEAAAAVEPTPDAPAAAAAAEEEETPSPALAGTSDAAVAPAEASPGANPFAATPEEVVQATEEVEVAVEAVPELPDVPAEMPPSRPNPFDNTPVDADAAAVPVPVPDVEVPDVEVPAEPAEVPANPFGAAAAAEVVELPEVPAEMPPARSNPFGEPAPAPLSTDGTAVAAAVAGAAAEADAGPFSPGNMSVLSTDFVDALEEQPEPAQGLS